MGDREWMILNQKYWVLCVTGEHTVLLTWLEFPDYNMQMR